MKPALSDLTPTERVVYLATRRPPQERPWGFTHGFLAGVAATALLVLAMLTFPTIGGF
jgi:hypothetical protein